MPSAGDTANLRPNLRTLAQLRDKRGAKLSYDRNGGLFSIQEKGKWQSIARTFSRDSVTSEENFGAPMRELFAAAHAQIGVGADPITQAEITLALDGLKALRASYFGDYDKLTTLDSVIADAKLGVKKEPGHGISLRQRYAQYVTFGLAQAMFLPQSNSGVCYSFTVHWARRILMGKASFSDSEFHPTQLGPRDKERIMKKVDRWIRPMQAELKDWEMSQFGTTVMHLGRAEGDTRFHIYGKMFVLSVTDRHLIAADARGSQVMRAVLDVAKAQQAQFTIFIINFSKGTQAHAIGIHLKGALHFFDPNAGEFDFPDGSDADLTSFLDDWYKAFYSAGWADWGLEGVRQRG
jgi:hypothetical protein